MNSGSTWIISLSCLCIWPLLWGVCGYFIGRNKLRIQSPFVIGDRPPASTIPIVRQVREAGAKDRQSFTTTPPGNQP